MESNQAGVIKIYGMTPEELARDFLAAAKAGDINIEFGVQVMIERIYIAAVESVAADWFNLEAKAILRAQFEDAQKRRDFEFKGLNRAGVVS